MFAIVFSQRQSISSLPTAPGGNLLPLRLRRESCLLDLMNKKLFKNYGTFHVDARTSNRARGGRKVAVTFPKTETFRKSAAYTGPRLWNKLPAECTENAVPWIFKRNLKRYYPEHFKKEKYM